MNNQLFIDIPSNYENDKSFFLQGSNPELMNKLFEYIDANIKNIKSIKLAWYLFNNPTLLSRLISYAKKGINIEVISIPLDGYDSSYSSNIINYPDGDKHYGKFTKKELAADVYDKCISVSNEIKNFKFYIFPHMYIRSKRVKRFSRGSLPYSLHVKSFIIEFNDGNGTIGLTSSNFATRDEIKDNILFLMEHSYCDFEVSKHFFQALRQNSIEIRKFNQVGNSINYFKYPIETFNSPRVKANSVFTAPFYKDSLSYVNTQLSNLLKSAKHRIYICAQHIAMYENKGDGKIVPEFLGEVFRASQNGVKVNFLSQTYVDDKGDSHGQRTPGNKSSFKAVTSKINSLSDVSYYVNSTVHSKFIIIDDWAIITTCNFTPTEFIYRSKVKINEFDNFDNLEYEGIFSEVGQFIFIHDRNVVNYLIDSFHNIINRSKTYKAK